MPVSVLIGRITGTLQVAMDRAFARIPIPMESNGASFPMSPHGKRGFSNLIA